MVDYSRMDTFCKVATWNTGHPSDQRRFVNALMEIVDDPGFHPSEMVEYIRANRGSTIWPKSEDDIDEVLANLEQQAFAVWYSRRPDAI
jgi:hypothetical protein